MADGKLLRVLTSEYLPDVKDRSRDVFYFVYDKMELYSGTSLYSDAFCIVEDIPESPVEGMLYITTGGLMKMYIDYEEVILGSCQTEDEIRLLIQAGTTYFMKAEYRYLDLQSKSLILPYQNGTYQLSVNLMKCLEIDKDTVIRYDETTGHFEIDGNRNDTELHTNHGYEAIETDGIKTVIEGNRIYSNVKLVENKTNIIRMLAGGLYANMSQYATNEEFDLLAQLFTSYRTRVEALVNELHTEMEDKGYTTTTEMISEMIADALEDYKPTIDQLIENYELIYQQLGYIRDIAVGYTDEKVNEAKEDILNYIDQIREAWAEYDHENNVTDDDLNYTAEEQAYLAAAVEKARNDIKLKRDNSGIIGNGVPFAFMYIGTTDNIPATKQITPPRMAAISEKSRIIGYTHIVIYDEKLAPSNLYYYTMTNDTPAWHEDIVANSNYKRLQYDDIQAENGQAITLVEVDSNKLAVRFAIVNADVREEEYTGMPVLNIEAQSGTHDYTMRLTVDPPLESGDIYMYAPATNIPEYNEMAPAGYLEWDGTGEIDLTQFPEELIVLAECEAQSYRVRKLGTFRGYANEVLKKLEVNTTYGDKSETSKVSVYPHKLKPGNEYYISTDTKESIFNALIPLDYRWKYWDGVSDAPAKLGGYLTVVETDQGKAKRIGYMDPAKVNNTFDYYLDNDSIEYSGYLVNTVVNTNTTGIFYKNYVEGDSWLQCGDSIPVGFTAATMLDVNTFVIPFTRNRKLSIITSNDNTTVFKFSDKIDPMIEYPEHIDMSPSKSGNILTLNATISFPANRYFYQLMTQDDEREYYLYEPLDSLLFTEWDKMSTITIESSDFIMVKLVAVDENNKIIAFGKEEFN